MDCVVVPSDVDDDDDDDGLRDAIGTNENFEYGHRFNDFQNSSPTPALATRPGMRGSTAQIFSPVVSRKIGKFRGWAR